MNSRNLLAAALCLSACGSSAQNPDAGVDAGGPLLPRLGAQIDVANSQVHFRLASERATRIELWIYDTAMNAAAVSTHTLTREASSDVWAITLPTTDLPDPVYYGYRAWGPNWTHDTAWQPGTDLGFVTDVDAQGNRFNPNKLLYDPRARELSHDAINPQHTDWSVYRTGDADRNKDSGPKAPKGVVIAELPCVPVSDKPQRPLADEIVYEVHVRGLTMNDTTNACPGTYQAAGQRAAQLAQLGITAIEFLPIHETLNDANDVVDDAGGDNYWGYSTASYFAPDRRYACDKSAGGPTREFRDMVLAFHQAGIKVYLDVVYNHTIETGGGGPAVTLFSWRGIDNDAYYELTSDGAGFVNNNGVGPNVDATSTMVRDMVIDSLLYYRDLGVDGFRFDLASVLANACVRDCFDFDPGDPNGILLRSVNELPARPLDGGEGVDLIAEPWGIGAGTYQLGSYPLGWASWNDQYRDLIRKDQNRMGVDAVTPGELATRIAGSSDIFANPTQSLNFIVSHDGMTLSDLHSCNQKNNGQPWPMGPSNGGTDNDLAWDHGQDPAAQRQAVRTSLALLLTSAGPPMITGGDEMLRTQRCNNNSFNIDSFANWLDWDLATPNANQVTYASRLFQFRNQHPALRRRAFYDGTDHNQNGLADITWVTDTGTVADGAYMGNNANHFLGYRIDGTEATDSAASIYVAYNGWSGNIPVTLPVNLPGRSWYRAGDTAASMETESNFSSPGSELPIVGGVYTVAGRSITIFIER